MATRTVYNKWTPDKLERVRQLYWEEQLCCREIATIFGIGETAIQDTMRKYGIPTRRLSEGKKLYYSMRPWVQIGSSNANWKGGRSKNPQGYMTVLLYPSDPYFPMAIKTKRDSQVSGRRVLEHRLLMAQKIGRCLQAWEIVHHINGIRDDNRIENLNLVSPIEHHNYGELCSHCELRKEIRLLRFQIKELQKQLQGNLLIGDISKDTLLV